MRRLERVLWALFLITALLVGGAEAQSNATIIRALNRFLNQPHTWTQVQTFLLGTSTGAGTGLTVARPGGVIFTGYTTATCNVASLSNVGVAETDLCSYTMLGGTLGVNGQKIRVTAFGTNVNNANLKAIRMYFGAVSVSSITGQTTPTGWGLDGIIIRSGATTQIGFGGVRMHVGTQTAVTSPLTETLSGPVVIRVTGLSGTAGGDVTLNGMTVEWLPQ